MQTTSLQTLQLPLQFSGNFTSRISKSSPRKRDSYSISARKRDSNNGQDKAKGKLVDENMIVLRIRIQEMKMKEQQNNYVQDYWMDNYESDIFEGVGLLQILLMNSRPSLVLGMVALLMFSLSTSLAVVLCYLLDFVMGIY
ncbi:hypothetical protein BUALT_Bualt05G0114700 [Buddleja alternifolia]|uniref:Uncharacterized protein n=1 Tax=Buddleja alternifolia TaxID=168488 RepID=A0AAV6XKE5_9LAMI|nr:hypothetical protein BUALT_Bualt05G0114700 [Buddleja alternifolia]